VRAGADENSVGREDGMNSISLVCTVHKEMDSQTSRSYVRSWNAFSQRSFSWRSLRRTLTTTTRIAVKRISNQWRSRQYRAVHQA
jgi:hypothetical protein